MLIDKIKSDLLQAQRDQDSFKLSVLRMAVAAIKNKEIELKTSLNDDQIIASLQSQKKQRLDSIEAFNKGGRGELAQKEQEEIDILNEYLPEQMREEELESIVKDTIKELNAGPSDIGRVIGAVLKKTSGRTTGDQVAPLVKKLLTN